MKRFMKMFAVFALIFMLTAPAYAELQDMWAEVYALDRDGADLRKISSGVTFKVLAVNADTSETLYYPNGSTSLTNPVTTTNYAADTVCHDRVAFRVDPTDSSYDRYVDLIVVDTAGGYTAFVEDFDKYQHTIIIDERPNIQHHGCIWFAPSDNTETDTGIDFDYDTQIKSVSVEVVTVDATETIAVGLLSSETSGDADGFLATTSVATAGIPLTTLTTSGALMDDGTNFDPDGHSVVSANAKSLTYTGTAGSDTAAGYIHYFFTRMR